MSTSFKELVVWQKSMELVENIYYLTDNLPDSEKFHITSQIHRCATSIPANIAEGHGRGSSKTFRDIFLLLVVQHMNLKLSLF